MGAVTEKRAGQEVRSRSRSGSTVNQAQSKGRKDKGSGDADVSPPAGNWEDVLDNLLGDDELEDDNMQPRQNPASSSSVRSGEAATVAQRSVEGGDTGRYFTNSVGTSQVTTTQPRQGDVLTGNLTNLAPLDPSGYEDGFQIAGYETRAEANNWPLAFDGFAGRWVGGFEDSVDEDGQPVARVLFVYSNRGSEGRPQDGEEDSWVIKREQAWRQLQTLSTARLNGQILYSRLLDQVLWAVCFRYLEKIARCWRVSLVRADGTETTPRYTLGEPGLFAMTWMRDASSPFRSNFVAVKAAQMQGMDRVVDVSVDLPTSYTVWVRDLYPGKSLLWAYPLAMSNREAAEEVFKGLLKELRQKRTRLNPTGLIQVEDYGDRGHRSLVNYPILDFAALYAELVGEPLPMISRPTPPERAVAVDNFASRLVGQAIQAEMRGQHAAQQSKWRRFLNAIVRFAAVKEDRVEYE